MWSIIRNLSVSRLVLFLLLWWLVISPFLQSWYHRIVATYSWMQP